MPARNTNGQADVWNSPVCALPLNVVKGLTIPRSGVLQASLTQAQD